jgi:hypothetical protein
MHRRSKAGVVLALPIAAVDPITGALVVIWNDQALGDPDILSIRSTDGGATWSSPIAINDDGPGDAQFFPWIAFDPSGTAHAIWFDRRDNGTDIDVYYATSDDAGLTWKDNLRVTANAFTPILPWESGAANFIGDYNGIAANAGAAYAFYQDSREGNQDVWVAVLGHGEIFGDGFEGGDTLGWNSSTP